MQSIKVWDPLVRVFHWSLVAAFATAWLTADEWQSVHEVAGYGVMGLIAFRLVWGLVGSRYARFRQFVRPPAATLGYLNEVCHRREKRYLGHNPAGAAMVLALLAGLSLLTLSGWLSVTDAGGDWLEDVHEFIANALLGLVGLHIAGVIFTGLRHRENLIKSMFTGTKRPPDGDDVA